MARSADFGVFAGKAALGAAWKTAGGAKSGSLPIKRTGPSFPAAITAALVVIDGVHSLVWSRGNGPKAALSGQPGRRSGGRARRARAGGGGDTGYSVDMTALAALAAGLIACTAPTVHDGDTLRCGSDRIRLFGVDAPEVKRGQTPAEPLAYEARDLLITLTRGRVGCRVVDHDRYGRSVARCWSDATPDINAALIRSGLATEYRRYSKGGYAAAEAEAKQARRGAWK